MLLTKDFKVVVNFRTLTHYSQYYPDVKIGDEITVKFEELQRSSKNEVEFKCDTCGAIKTVKYIDYMDYGYSGGNYMCKKCKSKKNNLEKYGVENVFQMESIKEKSKKTNLIKYGVENVSNSIEIVQKKTTGLQGQVWCEGTVEQP